MMRVGVFSIVFAISYLIAICTLAQVDIVDTLTPEQKQLFAGHSAGPWLQDFRNEAVQIELDMTPDQIAAITALCDETELDLKMDYVMSHQAGFPEILSEFNRQRDMILSGPQLTRLEQVRIQRDWMHSLQAVMRQAGVELTEEQSKAMLHPLADEQFGANPLEREITLRGELRKLHAERERNALSMLNDQQWSRLEEALGEPFDVVGAFGPFQGLQKPWACKSTRRMFTAAPERSDSKMSK